MSHIAVQQANNGNLDTHSMQQESIYFLSEVLNLWSFFRRSKYFTTLVWSRVPVVLPLTKCHAESSACFVQGFATQYNGFTTMDLDSLLILMILLTASPCKPSYSASSSANWRSTGSKGTERGLSFPAGPQRHHQQAHHQHVGARHLQQAHHHQVRHQ